MTWTMAHPWMTFWLGVLMILLVDHTIANVLRFLDLRDQRRAEPSKGERG